MKKILLCSLALLIAAAVWATGIAEDDSGQSYYNKWGVANYGIDVDHTTYGWVTDLAEENSDGTVSVTIMEVPAFQKKTYTTAISLADAAHTNTITGITKAAALAEKATGLLQPDAFVEIQFDARDRCINIEIVEFHNTFYMDSASYGGELTAKGGKPGSMVAMGWILGKSNSANTITIGDGNQVTNVFNETYTLADDCDIYLVDNSYNDGIAPPPRSLNPSYMIDGSWELVKKGSFADINVTKKKDGNIYFTKDRWQALCVFDSNYQSSWKDGSARVKELYLFDNAIGLHAKEMNIPDGMQYNGTSWYPVASAKDNKNGFTYTGSAEPFAMLEGRAYSIGDTYTHIYLFVGDDGTLSTLDMGNRGAAYQYWLNMEKLGFDPRDLDNIILTHGHGDHYQALYEGQLMIERAGNEANVMVNKYAQGLTVSNKDNSTVYELNGTLPDKPVLYVVDSQPEWDQWLDFMGPGADTWVWRSIGHSSDTASFVFKLTATAADEYFDEGDIVSLVYFGGYGAVPPLSRGVNRNQIAYSMQYEGAIIAPWAASQSDYVYPLPQHTNQYVLLEMWKAAKLANIPFMEGFTEGTEQITNMMEKRFAVMTYENFNKDFWDKTDPLGNELEAKLGFRCTSSADRYGFMDTLQDDGPFKRPAGVYTIAVQGVQVLHGFDPFLNQNDAFAGQTNLYGYELNKGFLIDKDAYTMDRDGWYVQVICNVDDDYDGGLSYDDNFYKGQYTSGKNNEPISAPWLSGPIEFGNNPDGWVEILRCERFDTKAEAMAYASKLTGGSYTRAYETHSVGGGNLYNYSDTNNHGLNDYGSGAGLDAVTRYMVDLTKASEIIVNGSFESTFRKVN